MKIFKVILLTILFSSIGIFSLTEVSANDVSTMSNFSSYEDSFSYANEEKSYQITIDVNNMSTVAICIVRTGKTDIHMEVSDKNKKVVGQANVLSSNGRRWIFINILPNDNAISYYTITLSPINYNNLNSNFRLMIGDKNNVEEMISGINSIVNLDIYSEKKGNAFFSYYTPNNYESWYKFIAPADPITTITVLTKDKNIRFELIDAADDIQKVIYNSANDSTAHRNKYCSSYGYAEKAKIDTLVPGKEYFMIIYSSNPNKENDSFVEKTMSITVGKPNMLLGHDTFYSSGFVTGTKYADSPTTTIPVTNLPSTAVVEKVKLSTADINSRMSQLNYWSVILPSETKWRTSYAETLNIGYTEDSPNNKTAVGNWKFSFRPTYTLKNLKLWPGICISYYYEIGD